RGGPAIIARDGLHVVHAELTQVLLRQAEVAVVREGSPDVRIVRIAPTRGFDAELHAVELSHHAVFRKKTELDAERHAHARGFTHATDARDDGRVVAPEIVLTHAPV